MSHQENPQDKRPYIGKDLVPLTEAEANSGLLAKIRLGRFAAFTAVVEAPGIIDVVATGRTGIIGPGTVFVALAGGATLHEAHNYFRNYYQKNAPFSYFIKDKELENNPG